MDQHRENEKWRASKKRVSAGHAEELAEGGGMVDQRLEACGIAPHISPGVRCRREQLEVGIGQLLEIERSDHAKG